MTDKLIKTVDFYDIFKFGFFGKKYRVCDSKDSPKENKICYVPTVKNLKEAENFINQRKEIEKFIKKEKEVKK